MALEEDSGQSFVSSNNCQPGLAMGINWAQDWLRPDQFPFVMKSDIFLILPQRTGEEKERELSGLCLNHLFPADFVPGSLAKSVHTLRSTQEKEVAGGPFLSLCSGLSGDISLRASETSLRLFGQARQVKMGLARLEQYSTNHAVLWTESDISVLDGIALGLQFTGPVLLERRGNFQVTSAT